MRIRSKLGLLELILLVGFLSALGVVIFYTNSILQLKDFQLQSKEVLSELKEVDYRSQTLLTTSAPLEELRRNWSNSLLNFRASLMRLSQSDAVSVLGEESQKQLKNTTGWWDQIYEWYYQPALEHMRDMEESEAGEIIGSNGIFQTLLELNAQGESSPFIGDFYTLQNYQDLIIDETSEFVSRMDNLSQTITTQTNLYIRNSTMIAVGIIGFTILAALLVTTIFSRRLGLRIQRVESAIRRMSAGDFTHELHIPSKDEFETLSENYNVLKNRLQYKLNAVLNFMLNINTSLASGPDLDRILDLIAESALSNTEAEAAAVHIIENDGAHLVLKKNAGPFTPPLTVEEVENGDGQKDTLSVNTPILGSAVKSAEPVFIKNTEKSEDFSFTVNRQAPNFISSLIVSPLTVNNRVFGTITIEKRKPETEFTDLDFTHMRTFGDYAALTIDSIFNYQELLEQREVQRDIEIAANIQKDLLPRKLPSLKSLDISAYSEAARGISGDYYDTFLVEKGNLGVVICDVVGKGVPASLLMVMIRTVIRLVASPNRDPAQLLTFLNRGIKDRIGTDHFATMSVLNYDEAERTITYSNAAHHPLLHYRTKRGEFVEVDTPGLPIGVEKEEKYSQRTVSLETGDILLLFTDGIPEARGRDGREYGLESLKNIVTKNSEKSPEALQKRIRDDIENFSEGTEQHDDQTLIIMKAR